MKYWCYLRELAPSEAIELIDDHFQSSNQGNQRQPRGSRDSHRVQNPLLDKTVSNFPLFRCQLLVSNLKNSLADGPACAEDTIFHGSRNILSWGPQNLVVLNCDYLFFCRRSHFPSRIRSRSSVANTRRLQSGLGCVFQLSVVTFAGPWTPSSVLDHPVKFP